MKKIYYEDAYCLGLLYANIFSGRKMVLLDDLKNFYNILEKNVEDLDVNDMYATSFYDKEPSIYFECTGKNNEIYYVLYPNFDMQRAMEKYMGCLSKEVLIASQKENALQAIDLKIENNRIVYALQSTNCEKEAQGPIRSKKIY